MLTLCRKLNSMQKRKKGNQFIHISLRRIRPVAENKISTRAANRRIDLRIIMTTPKNVEEAA